MKGLGDSWLNSFKNLGIEAKEHLFCFLLCKWEEDQPGLMFPKIYSYDSKTEEISFSNKTSVIGDTPALNIIKPYLLNKDINNMEFDKLVDYLEKGLNDVAMNVNTVGGPIDVYVL